MNKLIGILGLFVFTFYSIALINHFRFNWYSDSLPRGIYRQVNDSPAKGKIAASCLTYEIAQHGLQQGYFVTGTCDTGIQPVIKPITAMEGDSVTIQGESISINDQVLPEYKVHHTDSMGRPIKRFTQEHYVLKDGEYWLMSSYKDNSYDSRYWGAVGISYIVEPVITVKSYKTIK